MQVKWPLLFVASSTLSFFTGVALTTQRPAPVVRIADLEIDPAHLDRYLEIVKEEMAISVRDEPGVLALYAVADNNKPNRVRFFEMYTDDAAYELHRQSPHFRKYFESTKHMITSRVLVEATPVQLNAKSNAAVGPGDVPSGRPAQAAPTSTAPAFYVAEFEVTDPEGLQAYSARVESTFAPFGGRFIKRGGRTVPLEGDAPKGIVVIAFDSVEKAQAWYDSPAYREILPIRHRSARSRVYILEGRSPLPAR